MSFGGFYKGEKKKLKKSLLEKKAQKHAVSIYTPPRVEVIAKGKQKYQ